MQQPNFRHIIALVCLILGSMLTVLIIMLLTLMVAYQGSLSLSIPILILILIAITLFDLGYQLLHLLKP